MQNVYKDELLIIDRIVIGSDKVKMKDCIGMESGGSVMGTSTMAPNYMLSGLDPNIAKGLRKGYYYMIFEVEAIDHTKPTANGRLYPFEVFKEGLEFRSFQNKLRLGGVRGEDEHPLLLMGSNKNEEVFNYNSITRLTNIDPDRATHSIIGYRFSDDQTKTYFTIKTGLKNTAIATNLLNGIAPAFSIRTIGKFSPPDTTGVVRATELKVLGIDYVNDPANESSAKLFGDIKVVDPVSMKSVKLELKSGNYDELPMVAGFESADPGIISDYSLEGLANQNAEVYYSDMNDCPTLLVRKKVGYKHSLESMMGVVSLDLFK